MRIDKKISIEVEEKISAVASDKAKIKNAGFLRELGAPVPSLLPPGMLNAAVKTPVAISVEIIIHCSAVPFIQDSAFVNNCSCSSVNNSLGFFPSKFCFSISYGSIIFFTSCRTYQKVYKYKVLYPFAL